MRFMGDYPLAKNQKDIDCIYFLLQALHHHAEMCDEIYCQLMKQTTNNKSTKVDSCLKGWRLMAILCAYYKSSELLRPYLFKYLENNATDSKRPYNCRNFPSQNIDKKTTEFSNFLNNFSSCCPSISNKFA